MNTSYASQNREDFIFAEQLNTFYGQVKASNLSFLFVVLISAVALWDLLPHRIFGSWLVGSIVIAAGRIVLVQRYQQDSEREARVLYWYRYGLGAAVLVGVVWLCIPLLFLPALTGDYRTFAIVILVGRTAAAATTFASLLPAIWLSVVPPALALSIVFLQQGGTTSYWLALFASLFVLFTVRSAKRLNQAILASLRLQASLRREQQKANLLNEDLHEKIGERQQIEEQIRSGLSILTDATSQTMQSVTQLLESTSQTAAAVTQTATTIEEIKQTAYVAGQKARTVSTEAQHTVSISQAGEHASNFALAGMQQAREHIESVAQRVSELGERSHTISDIITSVNDLAEQSNLLAINAAIEAAKAGEYGKGFSVVAQEVKNLAHRSKQATAQVQNILQEIRKATKTAELVTEQGTHTIETGVSRSLEAHHSIQTLAQSIAMSAQAVARIATSMQEQLVGMDQVALAMSNIRQVATQNVEGMRQIERAAQQVHEVGQSLKRLVDQSTPLKIEP